MGEPGGTTERRRCYRCGELEQETLPLRLLPGSRHLVLCPACYAFIWGWGEEQAQERARRARRMQQRERSQEP